MSDTDEKLHFGQYPKDYFDFIIIDECHRSVVNDENRWRFILDYFSPAVHLGMTAMPKREKTQIPINIFVILCIFIILKT
jgi:type I restriction enzyme R subunit